MRKLYVGCALFSAPEEFKTMVESLKDKLRVTFEVFDFIGLEKGTANDVYRWDIHRCVTNCDIFVAICDHPSIGLGYELATAIEKFEKPTLGLAHVNTKIGRLVMGIDNPVFTMRYYRHEGDIITFVKEKELQHFESKH